MIRIGKNRGGVQFYGKKGVDPDAAAFIAAAGITGAAQQSALINLVSALKSDGTWDRLDAFYPYCPIDASTATLDAYKFNLKDPRDLDAAFRITWVNAPTATVAGVQGNGINQYGITHYVPSVEAQLNSHHLFFFGQNLGSSMGSASAINNPYNTFHRTSFWGVNSSLISSTGANGDGFNLSNRSASNAVQKYLNSSTAVVTGTTASTSLPTFEYYLMARNFGGSPSGLSTRLRGLYTQFGFGASMTSANVETLRNALIAFNTAAR